MFNFNTKSLALIVSLLIVSSISGYLVYAWTGPTSAPPGSNAPQPLNIGTADQDKIGRISAAEFYDADNSSFYINPSGNSSISGVLTVGGDISDGAKTIYDSAAGRLDYSVLPYHKGDLTSDWASNSYTSGYYDVSNLVGASSNVGCGVSYGRGQEGTSRAACGMCYDCEGGSCAAQTASYAAATALDCNLGEEECRFCNNGTCTYYTSGERECESTCVCNAGGSCICPMVSNYCSSHNGVATDDITGNKIFCSGGLMWSQTMAVTWNWLHGAQCSDLTYAGFSDWSVSSGTQLPSLWGTDSSHLDCGNSNCTSWDPNCCASKNYYDGPQGSSVGCGTFYYQSVDFSNGSTGCAHAGDSTGHARCRRG